MMVPGSHHYGTCYCYVHIGFLFASNFVVGLNNSATCTRVLPTYLKRPSFKKTFNLQLTLEIIAICFKFEGIPMALTLKPCPGDYSTVCCSLNLNQVNMLVSYNTPCWTNTAWDSGSASRTQHYQLLRIPSSLISRGLKSFSLAYMHK